MFLEFLSWLHSDVLLALIFCTFLFLTLLVLLVVFVPEAADRIRRALANFEFPFYPKQQDRSGRRSQKRLHK